MILIGETIPVAEVHDLDLLRAFTMLEMTGLSDLKRKLHALSQSSRMEVNQ